MAQEGGVQGMSAKAGLEFHTQQADINAVYKKA